MNDSDLFYDEAEVQRQLEELYPSQPQAQQPEPQPEPVNREPGAARAVAEQTTAQALPEGMATSFGEWWSNTFNANNNLDKSVSDLRAKIDQLPDNELTGFVKAAAAEIDRLVLSQDEIDQIKFALVDKTTEKLGGGDAAKSLGDFVKGQMSIDKGIEAGTKILPTTVAALMGENDPWNSAPEYVKQTRGGEQLFNIARAVTPSVIGGAAGPAIGIGSTATSGTVRLAESALETAGTRNLDDTLAGRELAIQIGEYANANGYDGNALTQELIEGKTGRSQVLVKAIGMAENYSFNLIADGLRVILPKYWNKLQGNTEDAAKVLGKTEDEVLESMQNVNKANYSPDVEPSDSQTVMSSVQAPKPSKGNTFINEDALVADALRKNGLNADALTDADARFFSDITKVTDKKGAQRMIEEAARPFRRLIGKFKTERDQLIDRAAAWWDDNGFLADPDSGFKEPIEILTLEWEPTMTRLTDQGLAVAPLLDDGTKVTRDNILRNFKEVNETGFVVTPLILEKLGVQAQKNARQAINLEAAGIDFSSTIERFIELHEGIQKMAVPLRRAKRRWALEGNAQQRWLRALTTEDPDVKAALRNKRPKSYEDEGRSFETIHMDEFDAGRTVRELWDAYKAGDSDAGQTLKQYLALIAYGNPRTVTWQVENLGRALQDQLKISNTRARTSLWYAYMLSTLGTQVVSISSGALRVITDPLGAMGAKESAYGFGQIAGALGAVNESFAVARRSWDAGRSVTNGSKMEIDMLDLKAQQLESEQAYEGLKKKFNERNASAIERWGAEFNHNSRMWSLHPMNTWAGRALTAGDDALKTVYASMIASGLAWRDAKKLGFKRGSAEFNKLVTDYYQDVFSDGVKFGTINPAYMPALQNMTMQTPIPANGNIIDGAFSALEDASNKNAFWKYVSPFPKVSYNSLEAVARYDPTGVLRKTSDRYRAILDGEYGDAMQLQLKSQIAFGKNLVMYTAGLSAMGLITGYNSGDLPKTSFIIPKPSGKGYWSFDYGRFPPFSMIIAVTSDAVNGFRDDVISEGQYKKYLEGMVYSIGMASFDQSFLTGMLNTTTLLDIRNFSEGKVVAGGKAMASVIQSQLPYVGGAMGGFIRQGGRFGQPYEVITRDDTNGFNYFWNEMRKQVTGGVGQPVRYNELTGQPISKSVFVGPSAGFWERIGGSLVGQFLPTYSSNSDVDPLITKEFKLLGYEPDVVSSMRRFRNVPLTPDEQSRLGKDMHDVARLDQRFIAYLKGADYKRLRAQYQALRKAESKIGEVKEASRADAVLKQIHKDLNGIRRAAKDYAYWNGELSKGTISDLPTRLFTLNQASPIDLQSMNTDDPDVKVIADILAVPV